MFEVKRRVIGLTFTGLLAGLATLLLCLVFVSPKNGRCESFGDQAMMLQLSKRFDDFPAIGPTTWKQHDGLRKSYRIFGRTLSFQAYIDWRFEGNTVSVDEFKLAQQKTRCVIGNPGDRYLSDGLTDADKTIEVHILDDGRFYFDITSR